MISIPPNFKPFWDEGENRQTNRQNTPKTNAPEHAEDNPELGQRIEKYRNWVDLVMTFAEQVREEHLEMGDPTFQEVLDQEIDVAERARRAIDDHTLPNEDLDELDDFCRAHDIPLPSWHALKD